MRAQSEPQSRTPEEEGATSLAEAERKWSKHPQPKRSGPLVQKSAMKTLPKHIRHSLSSFPFVTIPLMPTLDS